MGRRLDRLPRYVHGYLDRHGKPRHYLRQPGRMKIALPGLPYSHEFMEAYTAALNNAAPVIIGASSFRSRQRCRDRGSLSRLRRIQCLGTFHTSDAAGNFGAVSGRSW